MALQSLAEEIERTGGGKKSQIGPESRDFRGKKKRKAVEKMGAGGGI
jgi:hypothetical protein